MKNRVLPHKSRPGLMGSKNMFSSVSKGHKEVKVLGIAYLYVPKVQCMTCFLFTKTYDVKQEVMPFISAAEMVKKFESRTRELDLSQNRSLSHVLFISLLLLSNFLSIATFKIFNPFFSSSWLS